MEKNKPPITWAPKLVKVIELRENLHNPKIIDDEGIAKLHKSLSKFGLAGTIVVNTDLTIIDGHSRKAELLAADIEEVWVSVPDRPLNEKEYKEMNAIFDHARASTLDLFLIENTFDEELLNEWDLLGEEKKMKKMMMKNGKGEQDAGKYPIIPRYDEKYEAIIIICSSSIDTLFIKNALDIGHEMSYKNAAVRETSIITSTKFLEKWNEKTAKADPVAKPNEKIPDLVK